MEQFFQQITEAHRQWTQNWVNAHPQAEPTQHMSVMHDLVQKMSPANLAWLGNHSQFYQQQMDLWLGLIGAKPSVKVAEADKSDRRFNAPEWEAPLFDYIRQNYLVTSKWLMQLVESANTDEASKEKAAFFTKQYLDAMSPTNFAFTNPEVMKLALETKGESLQEGMKKLMADMQKGSITMTDESQFAIGTNLAMTPGEVIFENELIQLIQYSPSTPKVYSRPLLVVPPCVNKYYIMDLQPANSMMAYIVSQGYTTFLVSWKSIEAHQGTLKWDDYVELGVIKAAEIVREISKAEKINVLSFCIGGELVTTAMPVMQARGLDWFESITLMTVMLDHTDPGEIKHFIDWNLIRQRESQVEGVIDGKELAKTFSALRSNDLIWNYVVNNYLKGKNPPPFDLLYWNSDSANLSLPMHTFFLRNMYLENNLTKPNSFSLCGVPIDLTTIKVPTYIFAAREDHIVPWQSAYLSTRILQGPIRFVLGASGHIAGAINPVTTNKRNYWVNEDTSVESDAWFEGAESRPGSWWQDWSAWLAPHSGEQVLAPKKLGSTKYKMIEPAPGRYVKARVV
ncbi:MULTISPECIES: PHA/PHB synthase family protein [Deefgea]|uniref:Class I poly(R)-hydroxyalkanoic acid synthase n=1 Tax=Deefgea chitinilytica TaxID=570276 RepID=A0ABS2C8K8_9NEIS|nr:MULTISPECIES: class I poly(R)-hydroxyalkanoic acid synthase [Deefgea]MBM5570484.1 class I poly(R)-hydroxyalkanoic acid synthase [Deefgea chitinilytica]MBM9887713.1 class I poly(R)-hydroxyalkanoic acid synthase [Deefgea sp. CFH1-16]